MRTNGEESIVPTLWPCGHERHVLHFTLGELRISGPLVLWAKSFDQSYTMPLYYCTYGD